MNCGRDQDDGEQRDSPCGDAGWKSRRAHRGCILPIRRGFYISFAIEFSRFFTSSVHGNGHVSGANLPSLESHYNFVKKKIDILESISVVSAVAGLGPGERPCKISENFSWVIITNSIIRRLLNLKLL